MTELLTLNEIGLKNKSDKSSEYHDYLNLYDKYFSSYRNKNINFLEIGILFGDSLKIFDEYFVNANITAIDIEDKSHLTKPNIEIVKGDQSDRNLLNVFEDNKYDIILDDGSHNMAHQQISLGVLFKKLKSCGLYVVEDLHTSCHDYRENIIYNNRLFGLTTNNSTIEFLNNITNKISKNNYLTTEEYNYLCENIDIIEIFETSRKNNNEFSITSIIKKK